MRYLILFVLFVSVGITVSAQEDVDSILHGAETAYNQGDYASAIFAYESLVDAGYISPELFYNLGNAYYEAEQLGLALLFYLRAQQLTPRDVAVRMAIQRIRVERITVQGEDTGIIDQLASISSYWITMDELAGVVGLIFTTWCFLVSASILSNWWRNQLKLCLILLSVCVLIGIVLLMSRVYVAGSRPVAVVISPAASAMSGPGDDYLELYLLYSATEIRVLEKHLSWARFELPDGRQGWINSRDIESV